MQGKTDWVIGRIRVVNWEDMQVEHCSGRVCGNETVAGRSQRNMTDSEHMSTKMKQWQEEAE